MYLPYEPLSAKTDSSAFVPPELLDAQRQGKKLLPKNVVRDWDNWVAYNIGLSKEEMWDIFSSEQIDSIGLTIHNFELGRGFIIGDETGIGKGRILSGICRWAITHNKKIMFFTEREHLFSDFWRDLTDTRTLNLLQNPIVFHSNSRVYNPQGELVLKGTPKLIKEIQTQGFAENTNFVMTNYSQISLKEHKKTKKDIMMEYCRGGLIIMDESHNATGDSNTKKFLLDLAEDAGSMLFSSATYIKDESQLELYEKVISFDGETIKLLKKLLSNDPELILRKIFTYELTKKLQFWRREHQPLDVGWKSIVCTNDEAQHLYINQYSEIINGLFELVNAMSKEPALGSMNLTNSWFSLGATINRLSRNLLLLFKVDKLVESVQACIAQDRKAVVVIDSTFASIINKVINNQKASEMLEDSEEEEENIEIDDAKTYELNFKQVLYYILEEVAGQYIREYEPIISSHLKGQYEQLRQKSEIFEPLNISPIDMIINQLAEKGIAVNEISGRTFRVNAQNRIEKINKLPKSRLVSEFNSGEKDVIIITRAGASGISLHASAAFKDQRVRHLYELEITNRPTYRLQFIGRVNRKNQVAQPEFFTIITRLPFEQRILNVEQQKLKTLQSHISGDDEKLDQENIFNFYTHYCDEAAYLFLRNHPKLAFQMGISLKNKKEDFYYIDSILKRCIVLNAEQQNFLYDYLIYCTECEKKLRIRQTAPLQIRRDEIKTFWHQLDKLQQKEFKDIYGPFPQNSLNQFKFPWVGLMKTISTYETERVFNMDLKKALQHNLLDNANQKDYLKQVLSSYYSNPMYNKHFVAQEVQPLLTQLATGKTISIKTLEGNIFGYVHNIEYPKISKAYQYDNLCLIHIKAINPHIHETIYYAPEDYYITLKELIDNGKVSIHDKPINWAQFDRPQKRYERINYCFVGHPVYMEFLRQSYDIGEVRYFDVGGKKNMCIMLPNSLGEKQILTLKKPIYSANKIMELLICKEIKSLSTAWQNEDEVKPTLKLEPTSGGYNLFIAKEISRDPKIIDYPLKKKLNNPRGSMDGFDVFMLPFKEVRGVLFMLENRDVIWFKQ